MSVKYSLIFLAFAVACGAAGLRAWDSVGWGAVPIFYVGFSFLLLAVAYGGAGPGLLLKQTDGQRTTLAWLLLAPYFLLNAVTLHLYRLLSREPAFAQVAPNLYFGRRLSAREAVGAGWVSVLDLAAEFPEIRPLQELLGYRSLPLLDATAPSETKLRDAVAWLTGEIESGSVYVHCALGHGRSACVVIAYLLSAGLVGTVAEGARLLQSLRPGVQLNPAQRERLRAFEPRPEIAAGIAGPPGIPEHMIAPKGLAKSASPLSFQRQKDKPGVRRLCPNDAMPIPLAAEVLEGNEVVRFFWCWSCRELFAFVGEPGQLAAGFAREAVSGAWRLFRAEGADNDVQLAVAAVSRVGPQE